MKTPLDIGLLGGPSILWAFDPPEKEGRPGGRPTLDEGSLLGNRDSLLHLLSHAWGLIGWQLERSRTSKKAPSLQSVREALEPLRTDPQAHRLALFLRPTAKPATAPEIKETRKSVVNAANRRDKARSYLKPLEDAYHEAEAALAQAGPGDRPAVEVELDRRRVKFEAAKAALEQADRELETLRGRLEDQQAYVAQTELLRFLRDRRHELNPLNLASAMAGLPEITYRVSLGRCAKSPCVAAYTIYEVFELIVKAWGRRTAGDTPDRVVGLFRAEVAKLPKRTKQKQENYLRRYLEENWPELRDAIIEALKSKAHPRQVPFLILVQLQRNLGRPKSALDRVLTAQERAPLP